MNFRDIKFGERLCYSNPERRPDDPRATFVVVFIKRGVDGAFRIRKVLGESHNGPKLGDLTYCTSMSASLFSLAGT